MSTQPQSSPSIRNRISTINVATNKPHDVCVDGGGNLYIADTENHRILQVDRAGNVKIVAGTGEKGFSGDGALATAAKLNTPRGVITDGDGNIYIADSLNQRVRKVDAQGKISTIAGNGIGGYSGDNGPATAAKIYAPNDLAIDVEGNLYIADMGNARVRKLDRAGNISTVAGSGNKGFGGDGGPATEADLKEITGVALDDTSNLFLADNWNFRLRKTNAGGTISTVAGTGTMGTTGDDGPATEAQLHHPGHVIADNNGDLYITSSVRVRKVDRAGKISTVAGGGFTRGGDGGPATKVRTSFVEGITVDNICSLYFAESGIRRIEQPTFAIPHNQAYNFGTGAFSVMVAFTPGTTKETASGKQSVIATGNIISKAAPYQKEFGGWELALIANPPGQAKGKYISFALYGKVDTANEKKGIPSQQLLAPLTSAKLLALQNADASAMPPSEEVFKKFTHVVTAVRETTGACKLYLNGFALETTKISAGQGSIDVSNDEPLNIGQLQPEPPEGMQGAVVRKVSLWKQALTPGEIINYANCLMSSTINFKTKLDYTLKYFEPKSSGKSDFEVQITGSLSLNGAKGAVHTESIDETQTFVPTVPNYKMEEINSEAIKLQVTRKMFNVVTPNDLKNFNFTVKKDDKELKVTLIATHPDPNDSAQELRETYTTTYEPDPRKMLDAARSAAANKLIGTASSLDNISYQYNANTQQVSAEMEIGQKEECVGYWNLDETGEKNCTDLSPIQNHVPADQRVSLANLHTVLPFYIEKQKSEVWCWAATSVSSAIYYNPLSAETQCKLVTAVLKDPLSPIYNTKIKQLLPSDQSCCNGGVDCDYGYIPDEPLKYYGQFAGRSAPSTFEQCCDMLKDGQPIIVDVRWSGGGGHFAFLSGVYVENSQKMVVISDPYHGITTMALDTFVTQYQSTGQWSQTIKTRAAWIRE